MQYLLERLATAGNAAQGLPPFDLRAAVRDQIQRLVGSHFYWFEQTGPERAGISLLPLAGQIYASENDAARYCSSIRTLIAQHEPRLTQVRVELVKNGTSSTRAQAVITGRLAGLGTIGSLGDADAFHLTLAPGK